MTYIVRSDELYHHGILGQKWGIRRYQNPDGTLTREGKARYKNDQKFKNKWDRFKRSEELIGEGVSKSVAKLTAKYEQKGMDTDTAMAKAIKRIETGKVVAEGVLTVAAITSMASLAIFSPPAPVSGLVAQISPTDGYALAVKQAYSGNLKASPNFNPNNISKSVRERMESFMTQLDKTKLSKAFSSYDTANLKVSGDELESALTEWVYNQVK